ncbi:VanW family protein [Candidatus Roizmanbacteria bacterium]|nr:VanW family protein [Candidatus Roizmanbacteria bacterium]
MRWIIVFLIGVFIFVSFSIYTLIKEERNLNNKIYPNVYINEIDFGKKSKSEVFEYFKKLNNQFKSVRIDVLYKDEPIATFSGEKLKIGYDAKGLADRAYIIGRSTHLTSRLYQKLATLLNWQNFKFLLSINYEKSLIKEFISDSEEKYDKPAKNALFKFEKGRVVSFRQEEKGQEIEEKKFLSDIDRLIRGLENKVEDLQLTLPIKLIEPEVTLAKANEFGIEELIAEGKSDFSGSIPERIHNVILASSMFNGVLIQKNSLLSFNETVGDISSLTGYKPAYIIKSGKTVLGDGGGVCQVSTTLFRAALNSGLPIIERTAHAYRVSYYENDSKPGFDATVFAPSPDLKIKNDTPASILIQTEVDQENNLLYFRFYGKKDQRKIEISPVTVYDVVPPLPEIRQDDPTLKKGVIKQVDFPAWGAKAVFDYKVHQGNKTSFEKKIFSSYRPWQAVYLVGTAD